MEAGEITSDRTDSGLRFRWWLGCIAGFVLGFAVFGTIGHGFTGPHEGRPMGLSALAHTVALFACGLVAFGIQRIALAPYVRITPARVFVATLAFVVAFQTGAYVFRPPFDYVFAFPVLGAAAWIRLSMFSGTNAFLVIVAVASFWLGIVAMVFLVLRMMGAIGWSIDPSSTIGHATMWVLGGGVTAIIGGFVSGWPMSRLLFPVQKN